MITPPPASEPRENAGWGAIPIHPLLAAAYPAVFLFATNAAEQISLQPLWLPLLLSIGSAALLMAVLWLVLRDARRAALMTTVVVVGFFAYGHAMDAASPFIGSGRRFQLAWLLLVGIGLVLAWRAGRYLVPATRALNLLTIIALVLNVSPVVGVATASSAENELDGELTGLELEPTDPSDLPDVYYIVPDRYAGLTALRETYDYDNEPFLTALEERGFRVARHAHANYIKTVLSLTSSLNMDWLDAEALKAEATSGSDQGPIQDRLTASHAVPRALKELGYRYVHIANWWPPTSTNPDADRVLQWAGQDEFSVALAMTTPAREFLSPQSTPLDGPLIDTAREHVRYGFRMLNEISGTPGPKYVFAHFVVPHGPYSMDADGTPMTEEDIEELSAFERYVRFLRYGNDQLLAAVDTIVASDPDAIILIQSDEGEFNLRYRDDPWEFQWRDATDAELEQKFGILFALRAPGSDLEAAGFSDDISPVNSFRVIFNARFGTDLPILPNTSWANEDLRHFYDFFDVSDRLDR